MLKIMIDVIESLQNKLSKLTPLERKKKKIDSEFQKILEEVMKKKET